MSGGKFRIFSSYEIEIKISLILLIAFLLSLNFLSSFAMNRAILAIQNKSRSQIDLALMAIRADIEDKGYSLPDAQFLKRIAVTAGVAKIEISDSLGNKLLAIYADAETGTDGGSAVFGDVVISDRNGKKIYSVYVGGSGKEEAALAKLALLDAVFRGFGLLAGLAVAALFIRFVMNPYRKIKSQARNLNINLKNVDSTDSVEYVVTMFQEIISQLKQKEEMLRRLYDDSERRAESLERYNEYILGSISTGVIICDNQGIITRFNRAAKRITGIGNIEENELSLETVFGKNHQITKLMDEALRGITYSRRELEIVRSDGSRQWIGLSTSQISDNENNRLGAAVLLTDLTKIKQMQALIDYQEKISALGRLSAGLAHELRNSIAAIVGFGKLLKKHGLDGHALAIAESILAEALATEEMLSRFLDFARPIKLQPRPFDLIEAINSCIEQCSNMYAHHGRVDIRFSPNSDECMFEGDPVLLKTAFRNLLINSYQAIGETGNIEINLEHDRNNDSYRIKFCDDGPGIEKELLPRIFEPFFTTKEKGTGLGMAIAKKIISAHFGEIEVSSRPGQTIVTITLPVKLTVQLQSIGSDESHVPQLIHEQS